MFANNFELSKIFEQNLCHCKSQRAKAVFFVVVVHFVSVLRKLKAKRTKCDLNLLRLWPPGKVKKIRRLHFFLQALDYYLLSRK